MASLEDNKGAMMKVRQTDDKNVLTCTTKHSLTLPTQKTTFVQFCNEKLVAFGADKELLDCDFYSAAAYSREASLDDQLLPVPIDEVTLVKEEAQNHRDMIYHHKHMHMQQLDQQNAPLHSFAAPYIFICASPSSPAACASSGSDGTIDLVRKQLELIENMESRHSLSSSSDASSMPASCSRNDVLEQQEAERELTRDELEDEANFSLGEHKKQTLQAKHLEKNKKTSVWRDWMGLE